VYKIAINEGNSADLWWGHVHAGASETAPPEIRALLQIGGPPFVIVADSSAVVAWAQNIPGWSDPGAPKHAPHPLYVEWMES
jgi:hypothetical protein